jgi:hypothetical protein
MLERVVAVSLRPPTTDRRWPNTAAPDDGERELMVAWLRYDDRFVKVGDVWLFAERNLYVDWIETRHSHP